jgi:hypothetical protein
MADVSANFTSYCHNYVGNFKRMAWFGMFGLVVKASNNEVTNSPRLLCHAHKEQRS